MTPEEDKELAGIAERVKRLDASIREADDPRAPAILHMEQRELLQRSFAIRFPYMPKSENVCFTGHRPDVLGGYDKEAPLNRKVRAFLKEAVGEAVAAGKKNFISGGALGVDQWAAEAVLDHPGANLIIALPFANYGENWPESSRGELRDLCLRAAMVHVVCEGGYSAYKNHVRNNWMVDRAGSVIAVWNGSGDGGTASCMRYAVGQYVKNGGVLVRYNPATESREPVSLTEPFPKRSKR